MKSVFHKARHFRYWALGLLCALATLFSASAYGRDMDEIPWEIGDSPAPGWHISTLKTHNEYLRFSLENGSRTTTVEIVANKEGPGEWNSEHYRIQPGPGQEAVMPVIEAMFKTLKAWDEKGQPKLQFTRPITHIDPSWWSVLWGDSQLTPQDYYRLFVFPAAFILAVLLFFVYLAKHPELRLSAAWVALFFLGLALVDTLWFSTISLPTGLLTPLQKGWTEKSVRELFGEGGNAGPAFWSFCAWLGEAPPIASQTLSSIVRLNIQLAFINMGLFFFVARVLAGSCGAALILTLVYVLNPLFVNSACSELPVMFLTTLFFLGALAVAVFNESPGRFSLRRTASVLLIALLVALCASARGEMALIGLPVLAVLVLRYLGRERLDSSLKQRLLAPLVAALKRPQSAWKAVLVFALIFFLLPSLPYFFVEVTGQRLSIPGGLRWFLDGIRPIPFTFPTLLPYMVRALPFGLVLLTFVGLVVALWKLWDWGFFPVAFVFLYQIFNSAANFGYGEMFRYLMYLLPLFAFFAAYGYGAFCRWLPPEFKTRPRRLLGAGAFLLSLAYWPLLFAGIESREAAPFDFDGSGDFLVSQDLQVEVRQLTELVARFGQCRFFAPVMDVRDRRDYWVTFDQEKATRLDQIPVTNGFPMADFEKLYPRTRCMFLYRSLDCNLKNRMNCDAMAQGRPLLYSRVFANRPYSDIDSYVVHEKTIRLGLYRMR